MITARQATHLIDLAERLDFAAQNYGGALADIESDEYDADIAQTRLDDAWIAFRDAVEGMAT